MTGVATADPPAPASSTPPDHDDGLGGPKADANGAGHEPPEGHAPPTPPAELPDDGKPEQQQIPELVLQGNRKLGLTVGGRKPDSNVLKLKGCKIELPGQYDREDRFLAVTTLQVTGNNDQDTIDRLSGEVKSTSRAQGATLCGIATLEDFLRDKIEDEELLARLFDVLDIEVPEDE